MPTHTPPLDYTFDYIATRYSNAGGMYQAKYTKIYKGVA